MLLSIFLIAAHIIPVRAADVLFYLRSSRFFSFLSSLQCLVLVYMESMDTQCHQKEHKKQRMADPGQSKKARDSSQAMAQVFTI